MILAGVLLTSCRANPSDDVPKHVSAKQKAQAREVLGEQQSEHPTELPIPEEQRRSMTPKPSSAEQTTPADAPEPPPPAIPGTGLTQTLPPTAQQ